MKRSDIRSVLRSNACRTLPIVRRQPKAVRWESELRMRIVAELLTAQPNFCARKGGVDDLCAAARVITEFVLGNERHV